MIGKGTILLVVGFGMIMGYVTLDMTKMVGKMAANTFAYYDLAKARDAANVGAQLALTKLTKNKNAYKTSPMISNLKPTTGSLAGTTINVYADTFQVLPKKDTTIIRLRSVASYPMPLKNIWGENITLRDTVEVRLIKYNIDSVKFTQLAWMTINEGNVFFITGDTIWGKVHSNSNIHVSGSPVFKERVTTSGIIDPQKNKAIFEKGYETKVNEIPFPNDLSSLWKNKMNVDTTQPLYVEFFPGTSAEGDGYVIVRAGSMNGAKLDSFQLPYAPTASSFNLVIYSRENIYVRGILDGRVSICSKEDIYIVDDIRYERYNSTSDDMLGLIAEQNVIIANNTANDKNDLYLDANIFARRGSFMAEDYNKRGVEGRIWLHGSITQKDRGPVGNFSGNKIQNGYLKSYYYDERLKDPNNYPPFYPGFKSTVLGYKVVNWWESYNATGRYIELFQF